MKKAVLIVSVGTSRLKALDNTTLQLKKEAEERFVDRKCYVAFSSRHILQKMNEKSEETYLGVEEAFANMLSDGIEDVVIMPTNLLNGLESEDMLKQIELNRAHFQCVRVGRPLLSAKEDYIQTVEALLKEVALEEDEALVLIGHGTNHLSNSTYQNLEYTAYITGHRNIFVGTMEGEKSQRMTMLKLGASGYKKVRLMPLLFVAGYHAMKDIAADSGSWKSVLEEAGYEVTPQLTGLGEMESIRTIFMGHLQAVLEKDTEHEV